MAHYLTYAYKCVAMRHADACWFDFENEIGLSIRELSRLNDLITRYSGVDFR